MADATRSKAHPSTGIPLPRGKENVRPSAGVTNKTVSFTNAREVVGRTRVSIDRTSNRTNHAFLDTLAPKRIPFRIHCDERSGPSERGTREESRLIDDASNEATRGRGTTEEPRFPREPRPSKIPRRSRSCSTSTNPNLSRRPSLDLPESTLAEIDRKIQVLKRQISEGTEEQNAINEPVIQESKVRKIDQTAPSSCPKKREVLPLELLYHVTYHEDLPIVEQEKEERFDRLSSTFLRAGVNAEQRTLVVIFMIHVGRHCRYLSFVVYQAVKLFDMVLDKISLDTKFVQLSALACLWIALKNHGNFHTIPTASELVALAKELYENREDLLIAYERNILLALNFNVTFADPFSLFNHHLINCRRCIEISEDTGMFLYYCGSYLIDLTLLDEQFCSICASLIAVTAAELALGLAFDAARSNARPRWLFWRGQLFAHVPRLSERFRDKEIDQCRITMLRRLLISGKKCCAFEVVYKKYSSSRYGRIAGALLERANKLSPSESLFDL